jgi:hypothetical protein
MFLNLLCTFIASGLRTFFPLMRYGVRLSTAFLYDLRGALAKES